MSLGTYCMIYVHIYVNAMQGKGWEPRQDALGKCKGLYNHC